MTNPKRKKKHRALPGRRLGRPLSTHCGARQKRPTFSSQYPLLITLRFREGLPSLTTKKGTEIVKYAIEGAQDNGIRVTRFKILDDRVMMIVEAKGRDVFFRSMKSFSSRIGIQFRRLVSKSRLDDLGSLGIFRGRYQAEALKTPEQMRGAFKVKPDPQP